MVSTLCSGADMGNVGSNPTYIVSQIIFCHLSTFKKKIYFKIEYKFPDYKLYY